MEGQKNPAEENTLFTVAACLQKGMSHTGLHTAGHSCRALPEQQSNRATEQQSNRATEQQSNRATEQQSNRATEQQSNRATE
ncbi:hypothetical protein, partial [Acetobacter senegalensis]